MSEEEIINKLKEFTKIDLPCNSCKYCSAKPGITEAIRDLLDLYKKEREKRDAEVKKGVGR